MPIDGRLYAMLSARNFPTIDWSDPYALSPEEGRVHLAQLRHSFRCKARPYGDPDALR